MSGEGREEEREEERGGASGLVGSCSGSAVSHSEYMYVHVVTQITAPVSLLYTIV